ncbi:MAG: molecular chaperone DnaJ [Candidatus Tokpelaia sp. JSC188]|nr:MAG: molecular chaperone DnaJ [Candidatus Tokpelaia sp. JSC188]
MRNPYTVLGVSQNAKPEEIKSTFRRLAKKYHPDHNQDDPKAKGLFAEINQAYEIIGNQKRRSQFDHGEIDEEGKPIFQGFRQKDHNSFNDFSGSFSSRSKQWTSSRTTDGFNIDNVLFQNLFSSDRADFGLGGGNARAQDRKSNADITASISISLEQAAGVEEVEVAFPDGKKLKIKLPVFVEDGQIIRLKGQGKGISGSRIGDALVTINFKPHPRFRLDGRALHLDLPVSLKMAVLGAKKEIETLDGRIAVTIPPWSSSDLVLRLKNKGLPMKKGGRAALYVHVRVMLPKEPDSELETLLKKYT